MDIEHIKKIKSLEDILLRVLIYGESGTGKTRAAATFPDPYFFDFDGGMLSVRQELIDGKIDGKSYGRKDWRTFRQDWDKIRNEPEHKTYVFDSLTTMSDAISFFFQTQKGNVNEGLTLPQYGLIFNRLSTLMYELIDLPAHVVVLAHVQDQKDELTGVIKELPLASGRKFPDRIPIWFDEVFKQEMKKDKDMGFVPMWVVKHSRKSKAKSRLGLKCDTISPPTYQEYLKMLKEVGK